MRITISTRPKKNFVSTSMSFSLSKLEHDCTEYSPEMLRHAIKMVALPNAQEFHHWCVEYSAFLSRFVYKTKAKAKERRVYDWMWMKNIPQWYDAVTTDDLVEETPPYEDVKAQLHTFLVLTARYITNNVNSKVPDKPTIAIVQSMFNGIYPK